MKSSRNRINSWGTKGYLFPFPFFLSPVCSKITSATLWGKVPRSIIFQLIFLSVLSTTAFGANWLYVSREERGEVKGEKVWCDYYFDIDDVMEDLMTIRGKTYDVIVFGAN